MGLTGGRYLGAGANVVVTGGRYFCGGAVGGGNGMAGLG